MSDEEPGAPDDCIIIGAGPAGLTAAIYLARYHLSIRMFDSEGTLTLLTRDAHLPYSPTILPYADQRFPMHTALAGGSLTFYKQVIPDMTQDREYLNQIDGTMPRLNAIPTGCAFNPRCTKVLDRCRVERPDLMHAGASRAACWLRQGEAS